MTACIQPKNLNRPPSFRSDPILRLADYKKTLEYWLTYPDKRIKAIVFAENSGYQLDELVSLANTKNAYRREIEFLQLEESERPAGVHYGFSDMEIIDHTIDHSKTITTGSTIIKTTGRLYFPKLEKLLNIQDRMQYDFFADSRDYRIGKIEKHYVVTTIFIVKQAFYRQHLYNARLELPAHTSSHMETVYFKILKPLQQQNIKLRFPYKIDPVGIGAHSGSNYNSFKKRIESSFLFFIRKFLPTSQG
jgi:hypothetical protein